MRRSAPAEKFLPLERSTTARTSLSAALSLIASRSKLITSSLKALCTSGRLRVTVATPRGSLLYKTTAASVIVLSVNVILSAAEGS